MRRGGTPSDCRTTADKNCPQWFVGLQLSRRPGGERDGCTGRPARLRLPLRGLADLQPQAREPALRGDDEWIEFDAWMQAQPIVGGLGTSTPTTRRTSPAGPGSRGSRCACSSRRPASGGSGGRPRSAPASSTSRSSAASRTTASAASSATTSSRAFTCASATSGPWSTRTRSGGSSSSRSTAGARGTRTGGCSRRGSRAR